MASIESVNIYFDSKKIKEQKQINDIKILMLKGEKGDTVSAEWGTITGTLSSQTDLQDALDDKADASDLETLNTSVSTNTTNIATNTSNISSLSTQVATNDANITTNANSILSLEGDISTNTSDIASLNTQVETNTTNISTNTSNIGDLTNLETSDQTNLVNAINEVVNVVNQPANLVSVGTEAPSDGRRVWFKKGTNLYNESEATLGTISQSDGVTISSSSSVYYTPSYIAVAPNTQYTFSYNGTSKITIRLFYYDEDLTYLSTATTSNTGSTTFTTLSTAYYIRIQFSSSYYNTEMQLEQGSTATTYEAYVEPGIYVDEELLYQKPVVLWENTTGIAGSSTGTQITLNDNVNNYSKIEVTLGVSKSECDTYILPIWENAKSVSVFFATINYYFRFRIEASDNTLTFTEVSIVGWSAGTSKLFRVVGYK